MVVNLNYYIHALANRQRKRWIARRRSQTGRPSANQSSRGKSRTTETRIAAIGAGGGHLFGLPARIQKDQRVMHDFTVLGTEFDAIHIHVMIEASGENEAT